MFVKPGRRQDDPALLLIVRGPNKRLLSPKGENVPEITFWYRRIRDGDVVLAEPPARPPPAPRGVVSAAAPAVNPAAARAAADAVVWHLPPAAGHPEHLAVEPPRLTAAEWARLPEIEPASGPGLAGVATGEAAHERDPAAPLLTRDEPSGQSPEGMSLAETMP